MGKLRYNEIAKKECKPNRNIVISETHDSKGEKVGYSVSEQMIVHEGEKTTNVFLKNGLGIFTYDGLVNLRDTIEQALNNIDGIDEDIF